MRECGYYIDTEGGYLPGCTPCDLPAGHSGPHQTKTDCGREWEWEYDVAEDCDVYWEKLKPISGVQSVESDSDG